MNFGLEYYLKKKSASIENPNYEEDDSKQAETKHRVRLQSLDTFRGICITIMIFVNYGGEESAHSHRWKFLNCYSYLDSLWKVDNIGFSITVHGMD